LFSESDYKLNHKIF